MARMLGECSGTCHCRSCSQRGRDARAENRRQRRAESVEWQREVNLDLLEAQRG